MQSNDSSSDTPVNSAGDDYEVGFGKPPKHTRFRAGHSRAIRAGAAEGCFAEADETDIHDVILGRNAGLFARRICGGMLDMAAKFEAHRR